MTKIPECRRVAAVLTIAALTAVGLVIPTAAHAGVGPSPRVLINEVYGGGGNSGGLFNRDFIELYNASPDPVDVTGWSVQYGTAGGTTWAGTTPLTGVIASGGYLLVGQGYGTNTSLPPIDADIEGTIAMSGSAGTVALVATTSTLMCAGAACAPAVAVVDLVGYGASAAFAGSGPAPGTTNAQSVSRDAAHTNTADNAVDFTAISPPTPTNSQGEDDPGTEVPDPDLVRPIAEVQGVGDISPLAGAVITTTGVVTATYPTGGYNGYVVQTPGTGGPIDLVSHSASDALFVFSASTAGLVGRGDEVVVKGRVSEFNGLTEITVTSAADLTIVGSGFDVAPATVPWPAAPAQREALESMLIAPQGAFTVSDTFTTNRFGEVVLAAGTTPLRQPTDVARPGSAEAAAVVADNAARRVVLDDGASTDFLTAANSALTPAYVSLVEPVVVSATAAFTSPLIVDWRNGAWKLNPTAPITGDGSGVDHVVFSNARSAAPEDVGGELSVASFNVLNYFTTLGATTADCTSFNDRLGDPVTVNAGCVPRGAWDPDDLQRQQDKIVKAINTLDADVVGLMEIENSEVVDGVPDEATETLVDALNADAGEIRWAYVPSSAELPTWAEMDVIANAIIYQPAAVATVGDPRALGTLSGSGEAFSNAREPIAQVFEPVGGGAEFLFVVNHFKSKGSAGPWPGDADTGDGQGASNESRVRQATALRDWVASIQGDVDAVVLAGDFNSYGQEDPLHVLYDAGFVDAEQALGVDESSYVFAGLSGSLDHVLLNEAALARATGADIWNINSGESIALEYSRYNYHGTLFYAPDPYRSSDHDPVLVGLAAGVDERVQTRTTLVAVPPVHINRLLPATLAVLVTADGRAVKGGTVEFREGDTVVGTASVSRGVATLKLPKVLPRGAHTYTASFVPADSQLQRGSTSNSVKVTVIL